jgi:hypothetical protein
MKKIFAPLLIIAALLASISVMAEKDKKEAATEMKAGCPAKTEEKSCCKKEEKQSDLKCCSDKSEKKTGTESKSCGKKQ